MQRTSIPLRAVTWSAFLVTGTALSAQQPLAGAPIDADQIELVDVVSPIAELRHPDGSAAGTWGGGRNYKASFHDGFVFYPHVGPDLPHQPLAWRTVSVRAGNRELLATSHDVAPSPTFAGAVCEYDLGGIVERYEILTDGVEQSFVIAERPAAGDLAITGLVSSPLRLPESAAAHAGLMFTLADGRDAVRYGAAVAIDANGRRFPVSSRCDGGAITLELPAADVERAAFPLVVDPLIGNVVLDSGAPVVDVDVLHETYSPANARTWVAFSREVAANDRDVWVLRFGGDFQGAAISTFSELSAWDARGPQLALARSSGHVMTVFASGPALGGGASSFVLMHRHLLSDTAFRTSTIGGITGGPVNDFEPDIGGRIDGSSSEMLIVFRRDDNSGGLVNTANSTVYAAVVDPGIAGNNIVTVPPFVVRNLANRDQEAPTVNQTAAQPEWLVAFQLHNGSIANDDWDIGAVSVDAAGNVSNAVYTEDQGTIDHKMGPKIAGMLGRYVMTYTVRQFQLQNPKPANPRGETAWSQRFDWDHNTDVGSRPYPAVQLHSSPGRDLATGGLAFDIRSGSHWAAAFDDDGTVANRIFKLGYQGAVTETRTVVPSSAGVDLVSGGVSFNYTQRNFPFVFGTTAGDRVFGNALDYDQVAPAATYGLSCGSGVWTGVNALHDLQQIGAEDIRFRMTNAPNGSGFAFLLFSLDSANQPGVTYGLPGCSILVEPSLQLASILVLLQNGAGEFTMSLPESSVPATLYAQWYYQAPGSPGVGLQTSEGLEIEFGR
ncbi:MAG: hypothetical protein KDE27_20955 [Planctomycetes bacterium]|nr:hypothetical protein [Planctomycetota bacterium]